MERADTGLTFFFLEEADTVEALMARIVPGSPEDPGAREAGTLAYLDRALSGPYARWQGAYREAVRLVNAHTARNHDGRKFFELSEKEQDAVVGALEKGEVPGLDEKTSDGADFFALLWAHVMEGMFSDPAYGGNRDAAGWKLVGFPGARYGYTAEEMRYGADLSDETPTLAAVERLARERPDLFYHRPGPEPGVSSQEVFEVPTPERDPGEGVGQGQ